MLLAAAALLMVASLSGGAIPGLLPLSEPKLDVAPRSQLAPPARCGGCGVIEAIGRNTNTNESWRVTVRLDDGSMRTLSQPAAPRFAVGDRVRIVNGFGLERA